MVVVWVTIIRVGFTVTDRLMVRVAGIGLELGLRFVHLIGLELELELGGGRVIGLGSGLTASSSASSWEACSI